MAIDNARAQEKQVQLEKTELKMELFRERELRETLEKQLAMEQKNRGTADDYLALNPPVSLCVCLCVNVCVFAAVQASRACAHADMIAPVCTHTHTHVCMYV